MLVTSEKHMILPVRSLLIQSWRKPELHSLEPVVIAAYVLVLSYLADIGREELIITRDDLSLVFPDSLDGIGSGWETHEIIDALVDSGLWQQIDEESDAWAIQRKGQ